MNLESRDDKGCGRSSVPLAYFLTTERLGFRWWIPDDLPLAVVLWGDPQVARFINADGQLSQEQIWERLSSEITTAEKHGVQYWPFFLREDGVHVGCAGLCPYQPDAGIFEIGFHLRPQYWGHGYALEAARGVVAYAFEKLQVKGLFAGHHPDNERSRRLISKLGFRYTHDEFYLPTQTVEPAYRMTAQDFAGWFPRG